MSRRAAEDAADSSEAPGVNLPGLFMDYPEAMAYLDQHIAHGIKPGLERMEALLEEVLLNTMYDLPSRTDVERVVIDRDVGREGQPDAGARTRGGRAGRKVGLSVCSPRTSPGVPKPAIGPEISGTTPLPINRPISDIDRGDRGFPYEVTPGCQTWSQEALSPDLCSGHSGREEPIVSPASPRLMGGRDAYETAPGFDAARWICDGTPRLGGSHAAGSGGSRRV